MSQLVTHRDRLLHLIARRETGLSLKDFQTEVICSPLYERKKKTWAGGGGGEEV